MTLTSVPLIPQVNESNNKKFIKFYIGQEIVKKYLFNMENNKKLDIKSLSEIK